MTERLIIHQVTKKFNKKVALHPISLKAGPGECIVLSGGNGAGKSTLLHIIAGISTPAEGEVLIEGVNIRKNRNKYVSQIGYMPDDFHAQETLTVKEFLQFYGNFRKVSKERVQEVIEQIGLKHKENEQIKHLSKGMRQRLFFGQAFIGKPKVLILDEPTNGLDPYWIDMFIKILMKIKQEGTTIVFSTHMMDVAAEVADRVLFLEHGHLIKDLTNDHKNPSKFMMELLHLYRKKQSEAAFRSK